MSALRRRFWAFVCEHCRGDHDGQPEGCQGGNWCDCQHRPARLVRYATWERTFAILTPLTALDLALTWLTHR